MRAGTRFDLPRAMDRDEVMRAFETRLGDRYAVRGLRRKRWFLVQKSPWTVAAVFVKGDAARPHFRVAATVPTGWRGFLLGLLALLSLAGAAFVALGVYYARGRPFRKALDREIRTWPELGGTAPPSDAPRGASSGRGAPAKFEVVRARS